MTGQPFGQYVPCTRCKTGRAQYVVSDDEVCHTCFREALAQTACEAFGLATASEDLVNALEQALRRDFRCRS